MRPRLRFALGVGLLGATLSACAQVLYFRPQDLSRSSSLGRFQAEWYTRHLQALQEPSLLQQATRPGIQIYRFLWLRTFDRPIAIRFEVKPDGTGTLFVKIASGAGGYSPGSLLESRTLPVNRAQTAAFLRKVESSGFWGLPPENGATAEDGSEWIVEGIDHGRYHVASQRTPRSGPIYQLGSALAFELAKLAIPHDKAY